jgi:hypothetical protein
MYPIKIRKKICCHPKNEKHINTPHADRHSRHDRQKKTSQSTVVEQVLSTKEDKDSLGLQLSLLSSLSTTILFNNGSHTFPSSASEN